MSIRSWLQRAPLPAMIRCIVDDGPPVLVRMTTRRAKWAEAERAIQACDPIRLEALDGQGAIVRTMALDDDRDEPTAPQAADEPRDVLLARIMVDAADRAAARHEAAYSAAFAQLSAIVEGVSRQAAQLATANARLLATLERSVAAQAEGEADPAAQAVTAMLAARLVPPPNGGAK